MVQYTMDDYEITKEGQVVNKRTGRVLKGQLNNKGYYRITLCGSLVFIHHLVAKKYISNPNNLPQVNRKNGIKTDNRVENLEWVDNQTNRNHAVANDLHIHGERCPWAKLTEADVIYIRQHPEMSRKELADMFNVAVPTISNIRNYRNWKKVKIN